MISIVAKIINLISIIVQNALNIASLIGKVIVASIAGVIEAILNIFGSISKFVQIVYEDNIRIFSEEIPSCANSIILTFWNQLNSVIDSLFAVYSEFLLKVGAITESIALILAASITLTSEILHITKLIVVFIGNTVWLILTFLPIHVPQLLKVGFKYVKNIIIDVIVDAYMALLKFTNFLTDVPLESFIGITSAIIIVRLCVHFRGSIQSNLVGIYWLFLRKTLYLYYTLYNYIMDSEVRVITHMASGQDISTRDTNFNTNEADDTSNTDTLCIICQERQKCVLTLPCRHVCLCAECCRRLYDYQRTCPICRTFIYHSVTVYL